MNHQTQPTLKTALDKSDDQGIREFVGQAAQYHGVGVSAQNERRGLTNWRINEAGRFIEAWIGGEWVPVGGGEVETSPETLSTMISSLPAPGIGIVRLIAITIDGEGAAITVGVVGHIPVPWKCRITGWVLLADRTGSIAVDVWKTTYELFDLSAHPVDADSITAGLPPGIASNVKGRGLVNDVLTWNRDIAPGDSLTFKVDACTDVQRVTLALIVVTT